VVRAGRVTGGVWESVGWDAAGPAIAMASANVTASTIAAVRVRGMWRDTVKKPTRCLRPGRYPLACSVFATFSAQVISDLRTSLRQRYEPLLGNVRRSETAKAAGLAGAMIGNNVIALGSTIVFARLLDDYGSLAALVSYVLILAVAGYAMQVATAREGVLGHLGVGSGLTATLKRWTRSLLWITAGVTVVSILLRHPIAAAVGVKKDAWAAALGLPAGCIWLELSILRGALQGIGDYKSVGISLVSEQATRLVVGAALAGAGLGVTGAYLGTPISFIAMSVFCAVQLRRHVVATSESRPAALSLWTHVRRAWAPIAGLIVIAVLQNIDIIAAKHQFTKDTASAYSATAVAAKVLIWVAMGAGFYLVPEVSRRRAAGEDTRPVLARAMAIIAVCGVPCLLIFAAVPHQLLSIAFGSKRATASNSLLVLGVAFTVLAATYLAIQYMLALKRTWFLVVVGAVAAAEPVLLLQASRRPAGFAAVVLAVQAVGALLAFAIALHRSGAPPATAVSPEPGTPSAAPLTKPAEPELAKTVTPG
jgi:O-antigen/teichoic acid export membrane protein